MSSKHSIWRKFEAPPKPREKRTLQIIWKEADVDAGIFYFVARCLCCEREFYAVHRSQFHVVDNNGHCYSCRSTRGKSKVGEEKVGKGVVTGKEKKPGPAPPSLPDRPVLHAHRDPRVRVKSRNFESHFGAWTKSIAYTPVAASSSLRSQYDLAKLTSGHWSCCGIEDPDPKKPTTSCPKAVARRTLRDDLWDLKKAKRMALRSKPK